VPNAEVCRRVPVTSSQQAFLVQEANICLGGRFILIPVRSTLDEVHCYIGANFRAFSGGVVAHEREDYAESWPHAQSTGSSGNHLCMSPGDTGYVDFLLPSNLPPVDRLDVEDLTSVALPAYQPVVTAVLLGYSVTTQADMDTVTIQGRNDGSGPLNWSAVRVVILDEERRPGYLATAVHEAAPALMPGEEREFAFTVHHTSYPGHSSRMVVLPRFD